MEPPQELSIMEIRKFMLNNGCKVTNHALVKHFKRFLTHPETQNEARKLFKTYVNILAIIKNENNQKYLLLRKQYLKECPSDEAMQRAVAAAFKDATPNSPGGGSISLDTGSPFRQPPPYKPPPEVGASPKIAAPIATGANVHPDNVESYRECINEFATAVSRIDLGRLVSTPKEEAEAINVATVDKVEKTETDEAVKRRIESISRENSNEEQRENNKENIPRFSFSSGASVDSSSGEKVSSSDGDIAENPISVKEATRKFNRMASKEEAKIISPPSKKKPEKQLFEEKDVPEVTMAHPKAKEWIVSMAKANYQELAKLANDFPELVKLQDPSTGYTALHWAAKHGNEDVVKLIAGTHKADVNARTNGGYTPLHLAMQFGRSNIFELLCNIYKANRDLTDWSGNKPLDYSKQRTSVSASTYSSEYYNFDTVELNNHSYGLRSILGVSSGGGSSGASVSAVLTRGRKRSQLPFATFSPASGGSSLVRTQSLMTSTQREQKKKQPIQSVVYNKYNDLVPCDMQERSPNASNSHVLNKTTSESSHINVSANSASSDEKMAQLRNVSPKTAGTTHRKQSFLRKTLRAAVTPNRTTEATNKTE